MAMRPRVPGLMAIGLVAVLVALCCCGLTSVEASVMSASTTAAGCPAASLGRIALCQKVLRVFSAPSPIGDGDLRRTPAAVSFDSAAICKVLSKTFPRGVNKADCLSLAGQIYSAGGSSLTLLMNRLRQKDIHDVCVDLLTTGAKPVIKPTDASACSLAVSGGVTGLRCLILHGMGVQKLTYPYPGAAAAYTQPQDGWSSTFAKYFTAEIPLDGVCDVRYFITDTAKRGWDNAQLQGEYCSAIAQFNPHVIYTHSMGNLIVAGAIGNKVGACTRISRAAGPGRVQWYSIQAPWNGSPGSTSSVTACTESKATKESVADRLRNAVTRAANNCRKLGATLTLVPNYVSKVSKTQMSQFRSIATENLSGAECGLAARPLTIAEVFTLKGGGMWITQTLGDKTGLVNWGADAKVKTSAPYSGNDGVVPWSSCALPGVNYQPTSTAAFYAGAFSHQDGPCLVQDLAINGPMRQPCNWIVGRALASRKAFGITAPPQLPRFSQVDVEVDAETEADAESELDAEAEADADAAAEAEAEAEADAEMEAEAEAEAEAEVEDE